MSDGFLGIFELFLGVYLLYGAVTAKGQFYKTDNVKKGMEEKYKKTIRLFCVLLGIPMTINGVFGTFVKGPLKDAQLLDLLDLLTKITFVLWILSFIGVIVLFILVFKMTDRTKAAQPGGSGKPAPRAAFEFDEEEINNKPGKPNKK